jgi:hypothetical protein
VTTKLENERVCEEASDKGEFSGTSQPVRGDSVFPEERIGSGEAANFS